ncbi:MAG: hypothetical protein SPE99_08325, partial [Blautia sp.]|nr:hypothetical protein [Blautia sp.]
MKISKRMTYSFFLVLPLLLLSFTKGFWSKIFINSKILMLILLVTSFLALFTILKKRLKFYWQDLFLIFTCCFYLFWRNGTKYDLTYAIIVFSGYVVSFYLRRKIEIIPIIMRAIVLFALLSVFATWLQLLLPNIYSSTILSIFPKVVQDEIVMQQTNYGRLSGLAYHYSPNAFYVLNGALVVAAKLYVQIINKDKKICKKYIILSIIFLATLLTIGKRGHLLFFLSSLFVAYIIIQPGFLRKITSSLKFIIIGVALLYLILKIVPQAQYIITRITEMFASEDVTTGRVDLYAMAL